MLMIEPALLTATLVTLVGSITWLFFRFVDTGSCVVSLNTFGLVHFPGKQQNHLHPHFLQLYEEVIRALSLQSGSHVFILH